MCELEQQVGRPEGSGFRIRAQGVTERSQWLCPRHAELRDRERQRFTAETGKELEVKAMGSHTDRGSKGGLPVTPNTAVLWGPGTGGVMRGVLNMVRTL